jgi:prophage regulatory protein
MVNVTHPPVHQPIQFYRLPQLKARLSVSGSSIWSWVQKGTFPKPIKLSERCTAWDAASVERWATERIAASRKTDGGAS